TAAGLLLAERRKWPLMASVAFLGLAVSAAAFSLERSANPLWATLAYLTVIFLLLLGWVAWRLLVRKAPVPASNLGLLVVNAAANFAACYALLENRYEDYLGLYALVLAGVHLYAAWRFRTAEDKRPAIVAVGVAVALFVLAAPVQFSGFRVTMAWALQGAALTWIARRTNAVRLWWAGFVVLLLAFIRLFAEDAWIYSSPGEFSALANTRFLTFAVTAVALLLAAWWTRGDSWPPLVLYVAGHFVTVWALSLEVLGWAARTASVENLTNVQSASLSILLAGYAVALVAIGVVRRSPVDRVLGLGLIAVVVGKLYLWDVWELQRIYRVAAFGGLGVLLLAMSYLYSRFRSSIESWWKT
ncbi:MAG: DUF2339 domain-containing protein, partial [bacterium]|nr:DUF2339 domain-containing protein [bacterium]